MTPKGRRARSPAPQTGGSAIALYTMGRQRAWAAPDPRMTPGRPARTPPQLLGAPSWTKGRHTPLGARMTPKGRRARPPAPQTGGSAIALYTMGRRRAWAVPDPNKTAGRPDRAPQQRLDAPSRTKGRRTPLGARMTPKGRRARSPAPQTSGSALALHRTDAARGKRGASRAKHSPGAGERRCTASTHAIGRRGGAHIARHSGRRAGAERGHLHRKPVGQPRRSSPWWHDY